MPKLSEKTMAEQEAGRRAAGAVGQESPARNIREAVHVTAEQVIARTATAEDFGGVQVGPAPGGRNGRFVVMDMEADPDGTLASYIANRYADAETPKPGRPCDPEMEVEILAAVTRIGGDITRRPALVKEVVATIAPKGRIRDEETVRTRILGLKKRLYKFA